MNSGVLTLVVGIIKGVGVLKQEEMDQRRGEAENGQMSS